MKINWIKTRTHVYASYEWNILTLNNITEKSKVKEWTWASWDYKECSSHTDNKTR